MLRTVHIYISTVHKKLYVYSIYICTNESHSFPISLLNNVDIQGFCRFYEIKFKTFKDLLRPSKEGSLIHALNHVLKLHYYPLLIQVNHFEKQLVKID